MDTVGMDKLSSRGCCAGRAGLRAPPHRWVHIQTGLDSSVRSRTGTPEDAVHLGSVHGHHPTHAGQQRFGASPAMPSWPQHNPCADTPPHQPQWSQPMGVCPTDPFLRGANIPYQPETMHGPWYQHLCASALSAKPYILFWRGGGVVVPTFKRHTLLGA